MRSWSRWGALAGPPIYLCPCALPRVNAARCCALPGSALSPAAAGAALQAGCWSWLAGGAARPVPPACSAPAQITPACAKPHTSTCARGCAPHLPLFVRTPPPTCSARSPQLPCRPPQDFRNATHWPKHLLVHYTWDTQHEEDEDAGLLVLFSGARRCCRPRCCNTGGAWQDVDELFVCGRAAAGTAWPAGRCTARPPLQSLCTWCLPQPCPVLASLAAAAFTALLLGLNVARTYQERLRQFLSDFAGESGSGLAAAGGVAKAD